MSTNFPSICHKKGKSQLYIYIYIIWISMTNYEFDHETDCTFLPMLSYRSIIFQFKTS